MFQIMTTQIAALIVVFWASIHSNSHVSSSVIVRAIVLAAEPNVTIGQTLEQKGKSEIFETVRNPSGDMQYHSLEFYSQRYGMTSTWCLLILILSLLLVFPYLWLRFLYQVRQPKLVLVGPCGSGKTALFQNLAGLEILPTHTSYKPNEGTLEKRSLAVPLSKSSIKDFKLVDVPGHPRMRHLAEREITGGNEGTCARAVVFVLDGVSLAESEGMAEIASYLSDVTRWMQQAQKNAPVSLFIAFNKADDVMCPRASFAKERIMREMSRVASTPSIANISHIKERRQNALARILAKCGLKRKRFEAMEDTALVSCTSFLENTKVDWGLTSSQDNKSADSPCTGNTELNSEFYKWIQSL